MKVEINEGKESDLGTIAKIHRAARQAAMPWLPDVHTPEEDLWFFTNIVFPNETLLVACEGSETLGFAAFSEGWLNHLYVAPAHWRKGIVECERTDGQSNEEKTPDIRMECRVGF